MFDQSSPGETGQLIGINKRTLAWEVFYESFCTEHKFLVCPVRNKRLEYASPVWNPQQASFPQTRSCPT